MNVWTRTFGDGQRVQGWNGLEVQAAFPDWERRFQETTSGGIRGVRRTVRHVIRDDPGVVELRASFLNIRGGKDVHEEDSQFRKGLNSDEQRIWNGFHLLLGLCAATCPFHNYSSRGSID